MIRSRVFGALVVALAATMPVFLGTVANADPSGVPNDAATFGQSHKRVCPDTGQPGLAHCDAEIVTDAQGNPLVTSGPAGYGPADIRSAYNLTATGSGTVAIVDAYDDPTAEQDLFTYRRQFGLTDCTTQNGCFRKIDQRGGTAYPKVDAGWAQEISLDLDAVSAACPGCKILLVEADSAYTKDLGAGVNKAVALGASAVSNSYGGNEYSTETTDESAYFNHPGTAITVSSGDNGYGVEFPASSRYVTAVGGTTLNRASNARGWTETTWSGAGSGCSAVVPKPSWQHDTGCAKRTVADVSAVANPNTGLAVYDSTVYQGVSGWMVFGGTSLSSPIIAATYVLNGTASTFSGSYLYSHASSLNDVTSGINGHCKRTVTYLCTAGAGYDGPTGLGTPNGTAAF